MGSSPIARPTTSLLGTDPGLFGLALAGGLARRMGGGDKPLLRLGGRTMLEMAVATLAAECAAVAISANGDPERFAAFGLPVLDDGDFPGRGPLAGVLAGLEWAQRNGGTTLLTIPGDTPFVPEGIGALLAPAPACAEADGRPHPLVALWPVSAAAMLRVHLAAEGGGAVYGFARTIGVRAVPVRPEWVVNINTPDDLAAARSNFADG